MKSYVRIGLLLFILVDVIYSGLCYYHQPMDGELAWSTLPSPDLETVLSDPFGWTALTSDTLYLAPNRFFSHFGMKEYYDHMPFLAQKSMGPIDSLYFSQFFIKLLCHLVILFILAAAIRKWLGGNMDQLLASLAVITPLIQTYGYGRYMGIVDPAVTYVFFYALAIIPLLLLLQSLLIPKKQSKGILGNALLFLLVPICCLSGPINPGVIAALGLTLSLAFFWRSENSLFAKWTKYHWTLLVFMGLGALYSLYL